MLAAGLVLGLRFGRRRLLVALLSIAAADRALVALGGGPATSSAAAEAVALLLPLDFALLALLPEWAPPRRFATFWLGILTGQGAAVFLLSRWPTNPVSHALGLPVLPVPIVARMSLPQIALIAFLLALGLIAARAAGKRDPAARGLLWGSVASLVALNTPVSASRTLYFATGGLALVIAMLEASYALAFQDDLTALPARRAFNQALARLDGHYVVAMVDVDHFKQFNDRYGHDVGDQVLRLVANRLAAIEGGGKAFRYGGEEFAVLFPAASLSDATPHLESLRANVETTTFTLRGHDRPKKADPARRGRAPRRRDISVTVSVGAAAGSARTKHPSNVVKAADEALYRAKEAGRNQVITDG